MRVVVFDSILKLDQLIDLEMALLLEVTLAITLLQARLAISHFFFLMLNLAIKSHQLGDLRSCFASSLSEFGSVESDRSILGRNFSLFGVGTHAHMLDSETPFFVRGMLQISGGVH